jgi:hypothetical protein
MGGGVNMRRVITAGSILFLLTLLLTGLANAADYYVSTGQSIQNAIDAAAFGDTVFVAAGSYNENIYMKSGVSVIGNGPADTTIIGQPIVPNPTDNWAAVRFDSVNNAVLKGFTITQSPVSTGDRSVEFTGTSDSTAVLLNCIIYGVQYGIFVWAPATPSIVNNTIDGQLVNEQGIYIGNDATGPNLVNNIITGWSMGIHVLDLYTSPFTNDPNIEFCDVWGNTDNYLFSYDYPLTIETPFTPVPTMYRNRGDISANPMFVGGGDYHLLTGSPCLGSGFSNGTYQNPYIITPGDGGFDMGAYGGGGNTVIDVRKAGSGSGAVTSSGGTWLPVIPLTTFVNSQLSCPSGCTQWVAPYPDACSSCNSFYTAGSEITLMAAADPGSYFGGWWGAVAPTAGTTVTQRFYLPDTYIGAIFNPCTVEINPYKTTVAASSGQYTVSILASNSSCVWTATSNDGWITVDPDSGSGTGNGTVTYSVSDNTGSPARTGTITIEGAGQTFNVTQIDDSFTESIIPPDTSGPGPLWITATFTNNTGQPLITAKPTCCDTYFWVTDQQGNMVPPMDRVCAPVGIPDSLISLSAGGSFEITCDLSEMYSFNNPTSEPYNVMATYANPLPVDPDYDMATGGCKSTATDRIACYNLKPVVIPSAVIQFTREGGAPVQKKMAVLGFNPLGWDPQWASVDGPAISARISNIEDHVLTSVADIDLSSILLNGTVHIIDGSAVVQDGVLTVKFDRSLAVQSLGTVVPGTTAVATVQGSFASGMDIFYGQARVDIVKDPGTLIVQADLHTVGKGSQPGVAKAPIAGMKTRVFDKEQGSCAAGYGISWQNYPAIWTSCTPVVGEVTTDQNGQAVFLLPQGNYLVIGLFNDIYAGVSVGGVAAGDIVDKYLQVIQTANGQTLPAKYQRFTGSDLLVIEPEYVEWSGTQELYPFVFDSLGDWSVTTAVEPPEGFVADQQSLSTDVNSTLTALQFTVTDVGSKWVSTHVHHKIKHKGKTLNVESKIGLKLAPGLQKKLGLGKFGEKE